MLNPFAWWRARRAAPAPTATRRSHVARPAKRDFAGAAVNRLTASLATWSGSANAEIEGSLVILRARARGLAANHEYGLRFLTLLETHVVGAAGPALQVRARNTKGQLDKVANSAIESAWWEWCKVADVTGKMDLAHALRVIISAVARDGEALVRLVRRRDLPNGLGIQLLEADRLDETINTVTRDGVRVRMGVELGPFGRPVAYYVKTDHPGEGFGRGAPIVERVPADELLHVYVTKRAEQTRGYSWFHPVLVRMNMLHAYEEAAVVAARVGASKMGVLKRTDSDDPAVAGAGVRQLADGQDQRGTLQMSAEPGEFMELPPGYDFDSFNPDYPHANFDGFVRTCLRGIAAGLNVDYSTLANDLENVNYSSMRAGTLETRDQWVILQTWFITAVLRPIFGEWLRLALLRGDIRLSEGGKPLPLARADKFLAASAFIGRRWQWVDPLKDAQAARELIGARLASRTEIAAQQGRDFAEIVEEQKAEQQMLAEAGLKDPAPAAPGAAPADDGDDPDDEGDDTQPDDEEGKT